MVHPSRFVGLHSHSTLSVYDAIGTPKDHIDFAIKNGTEALALTDHGNMNGFSHQFLYAEALKKKGVSFKPIYGVEAYFIPSLADWETARRSRNTPTIKEMTEAITEEDMISSIPVVNTTEEEEEVGGTVVEDEEESKSGKWGDSLSKRNHVVLLAKNSEGLKALFRIVSESSSRGFYSVPRVDLDMLERYGRGNIIVLTACLAGVPFGIIQKHQTADWLDVKPNMDNIEIIQSELERYISDFQGAVGKENFYLELQMNKLSAQHLLNQHLMLASKHSGAPLVVTCDAHYSDPKHWRERELYKLLNPKFKSKQEENLKKVPRSIDELKCELYPKNHEQLWQTYQELKLSFPDLYEDQVIGDAIERTHKIAFEQIDAEVTINKKVKLPTLEKIVPKEELEQLKTSLQKAGEPPANIENEEFLAFKQLKKLAIEGLKTRKVDSKKEYIERLRYELETIKELGFSKYFLTDSAVMKEAGKELILGNARGSAGGSLLAYVLGITQVDPLRFGLLFERFLTKKKKSFPDIDNDASDRGKILEVCYKLFGEENVIPVSNFSALKPISLLKDLSRFYGIPFDEVNKYTTNMIPEVMSVLKAEAGFDAAQYELTFEDLEAHSPSYQLFMKNVIGEREGFKESLHVLWKQQKSIGRHAGGVIITNGASDSMPLIKAKGGLQTPWPEGLAARHLEDFGLLKFDFLGVATLRMFEDAIRRIIKKETGKEYISPKEIVSWYRDKLHPDNNPMDDMQVFKHVYWDGNFCGTFQFVKKNVQEFMAEMKPTSILDIAIATSIYRPGPLGLDADKLFLKNRSNPSSIKYVHPVLEEVLGPTSGLLIFQEQLQLIVNKLAGVPLEDTDNVRKAFTKKDKSNADKKAKELEEMGKKFVSDAMACSGISKEDAEAVWQDFSKWTSYGFNKCLHEDTLVPVFSEKTKKMYCKKIKDVKSGDVVASRDETNGKVIRVPVKAVHKNGQKPLIEVRMDTGEIVKCTLDHKFRVTDGRMLSVKEIYEQGLEIVKEKYYS